MRGDTTPWGYKVPDLEPTFSGAWWWADFDLTLWAIAVVVDLEVKAAGLLIGPFKIGVRW